MKDNGDSPDFWMVSTEASEPDGPRKCWWIKRLHDDRRDDYMLIRVDPPLDTLGLCPNKYADKAIIATRLAGTSLFPISQWPLFVYVDAVCTDDIDNRDRTYDSDSKQVDWAALLPTEQEARELMIRPRD